MFGIKECAVRLKFDWAGWFLAAGPLAPLGRRHPSRHERERFRRAHRTLLRVVHFFTVETEPCIPELHRVSAPSVPEVRP